jgi:hypothetical protein
MALDGGTLSTKASAEKPNVHGDEAGIRERAAIDRPV